MIILIIVVLVCAFAGIFWFNLQKKKAAQSWPSTAGAITASDIHRSRDSDGDVQEEARVLYSYTVNGKVYQSSRIGFITVGTASQLVQRYPIGKPVDVFYDPANPSSSVLQR